MITVMNMSTTKTIPRKLRLATACGEIAAPPSVATFVESTWNRGVWNAPSWESFGSDEVQSMIPMADRREAHELAADAVGGAVGRVDDVDLAAGEATRRS